MSEVSILYTDPTTSTKLRCRIDKLLPAFSLDLKTFGGDAKGDTTKQQCLGLVAGRSMDVQRYAYDVARRAMRDLPIFGANPDQTEWLKRVASVDRWQWGWVFYRRQDDEKGHAPVVKPILRAPGDATFLTGQKKTAVALANYAAFRDRFGFGVPWAVVETTEEPADHEFPPWLERIHEPVTFPDLTQEAA